MSKKSKDSPTSVSKYRFIILVVPFILAIGLFFGGFNQYRTVEQLKANCAAPLNTTNTTSGQTSLPILTTTHPNAPSTISSEQESDVVNNSYNPGQSSTTSLQPNGGTSQTSSPNLQAVTTPASIDPSQF